MTEPKNTKSKSKSISLDDIRQIIREEVSSVLEEQRNITEMNQTEMVRSLETIANEIQVHVGKVATACQSLKDEIKEGGAVTARVTPDMPFIALEDKTLKFPDGTTRTIISGSKIKPETAKYLAGKVQMRLARSHEV